MGEETTKTIKAVERTLEIVEVLKEIQPAGVSEIAVATGIPVSTTYLHLHTLEKREYVVKEGTEYRLSFRFLNHGGAVRQQVEYFGVIKEEVQRITTLLGEIVGFAVEEHGRRVVLYRAEGREAAGDQIPIGEYTYLHWTSLGKAILAHLPERQIDEIVDHHGLPRGTSNTITDSDELHAELETIRDVGYALDNVERRRGIRGVAVPIMNAEEEIIGSLGATGPKVRFDDDYVGAILRVLNERRNVIEVRNEFYR